MAFFDDLNENEDGAGATGSVRSRSGADDPMSRGRGTRHDV